MASGESPIYLDYNATTPLAEEVILGITNSLKNDWGNPSSSYKHGIDAKKSIEKSRVQVGQMLNANPDDIIFTSGGTEANNLVIASVVCEYLKKTERVEQNGAPHIITTTVEHDSVIKAIQGQNPSIEITLIPVNPNTGSVRVDDVINQIRRNTCLITVMHANNETGVIMPIKEIVELVKPINFTRKNQGLFQIFVHTDSAQTIGKIPVNIQDLGVDYLTIVGHKFYGPRIGALYVKNLTSTEDSSPIHPLIYGGGQERGFRSGTENTPMIFGLGIASELVTKNLVKYEADMKECRTYFETKLLKLIPGSKVNFITNETRLPNTISTMVPEIYIAREILDACSGQIEASLGAACHSHSVDKPSRILILSGLSEVEARRTIRFSIGRNTTIEEIDKVLTILIEKMVQS